MRQDQDSNGSTKPFFFFSISDMEHRKHNGASTIVLVTFPLSELLKRDFCILNDVKFKTEKKTRHFLTGLLSSLGSFGLVSVVSESCSDTVGNKTNTNQFLLWYV